MLRVGTGVEIELHPVTFHPVDPDRGQVFDHILERPLPRLALSILLKQRLESLGGVPLEVVGQKADEHVGADPIIFLAIDRTDL